MKYIKTYEKNIIDIKKYFIWNYENQWDICEVISKNHGIFNNKIKVKDLFFCRDDEDKIRAYLFDDKYTFVNLTVPNEVKHIKYTSNSLKDCKDKILLLKHTNKYNI